ncbi:hypothetical protein HZH68_007887 [Vespula germanica]|uniref:Uncharacterized protein n=1 Tax=Vespula germanica TaxID=30212 RepID=A0A834K3R6_VESGE|nr:hypothetical protein HZH68_007887 [Vespula germanica]
MVSTSVQVLKFMLDGIGIWILTGLFVIECILAAITYFRKFIRFILTIQFTYAITCEWWNLGESRYCLSLYLKTQSKQYRANGRILCLLNKSIFKVNSRIRVSASLKIVEEMNTLLLRNNIDYDYDRALPVYNDVELLYFQLTSTSTYFLFNFLRIILLQCGVTWSTSVLEPSQNFLSSE